LGSGSITPRILTFETINKIIVCKMNLFRLSERTEQSRFETLVGIYQGVGEEYSGKANLNTCLGVAAV
jgi:hypothetical protein